jgi:acyl carrier protein
MLPSLFIPVDRLSRTAHGKIDVAALERQLEARVGAASEGRRPTTALELRLADLWKSVLKCADVRLDDKFFQAGGNSLSAMRLLLKIRSELHADIALTQLFRRPTFAALVSEVEAALADGPLEEIPSVPRGVLSFTALMTDGNRPNPE